MRAGPRAPPHAACIRYGFIFGGASIRSASDATPYRKQRYSRSWPSSKRYSSVARTPTRRARSPLHADPTGDPHMLHAAHRTPRMRGQSLGCRREVVGRAAMRSAMASGDGSPHDGAAERRRGGGGWSGWSGARRRAQQRRRRRGRRRGRRWHWRAPASSGGRRRRREAMAATPMASVLGSRNNAGIALGLAGRVARGGDCGDGGVARGPLLHTARDPPLHTARQKRVR